MILQVSTNDDELVKSTSNLLWAYTFFQYFKHMQFLLRVSLEGKI